MRVTRTFYAATAICLALLTAGTAQATQVTYNLDNVSATFNVAPGVSGFPGGFDSVLTFTGSFIFDTSTEQVVSVANFDIFDNGSSLNAYNFYSPGYGSSAANGFTANTWTVLTNDLYVNWTFANDLALGATDPVTASSIYDGYAVPVTTDVTGSADPVPTPEPFSIAVLGVGLGGLALIRRKAGRATC